jgi:cobalamin biosynthesis Mg chelatase CobN
MVGVINPADGQCIDTQKSAAINADYQLVLGQSWPAKGSSSKSQSTSSSVPSTKSKDEKKLSGGAIVGIIIGMLLLAVLVTAGLVFVLRRAR